MGRFAGGVARAGDGAGCPGRRGARPRPEGASAARPEAVVQTLTLSGLPDRPAQVVYTKAGNPKGDAVWVQPYSGELRVN